MDAAGGGPGRVRADRSVISPALYECLDAGDSALRVIFDLNPDYPRGLTGAASEVGVLLGQAAIEFGRVDPEEQTRTPHDLGGPYVAALLSPQALLWIVRRDLEQAERDDWSLRAIRRVWPDFEVHPLLDRSLATIKADAARAAFAAAGAGITWAVVDSGIDQRHPHFRTWRNLDLPTHVEHIDFTGERSPLTDEVGVGHGTAVAGIVGGEARGGEDGPLRIRRTLLDGDRGIDAKAETLEHISGVAPQCKLVSYKVFSPRRPSSVSTVLAALAHIQRVNDHGRNLRIHGVNLSLGYPIDPDWFVGSYSPLCTEVDRLTRSGVVVVAAAGNTGLVRLNSVGGGVAGAQGAFGAQLTITDPGNARYALTVGSTHREAPHTYGVSCFSAKGPTGDGRLKPDLVAPGERVLSAASLRPQPDEEEWDNPAYTEFSGTSFAAPHVSGAIAAFLSVRREFIGQVDRVREIFTDSAVDLGRLPEFQGRGLVDLMRALQSV
ncbi:S8 family peptidase [Streptomyces sp. cf386]|uniref:S8 family peptidase n=1 Tax=Streptomyces sp. cf386 TaxID=1761904 RepID=UPI000AC19142|nr:S8 family peptidase [Streptomyces sp. cf386]